MVATAAWGCQNGQKRIKCEWLARMVTAGCPKNNFGDGRAEVTRQIQEAVA